MALSSSRSQSRRLYRGCAIRFPNTSKLLDGAWENGTTCRSMKTYAKSGLFLCRCRLVGHERGDAARAGVGQTRLGLCGDNWTKIAGWGGAFGMNMIKLCTLVFVVIVGMQVEAKAQSTPACQDKQRCKDYGECTWGDGFDVTGSPGVRGRLMCWVGSDSDCRQSRTCWKTGKCSKRPEYSQCVALTNGDCAQSESCKKFGQCTAKNRSCVK